MKQGVFNPPLIGEVFRKVCVYLCGPIRQWQTFPIAKSFCLPFSSGKVFLTVLQKARFSINFSASLGIFHKRQREVP